MPFVFAAILPHGPDIIPECTSDLSMMAETRAAMEEAARRFAAAKIDTLILIDVDLVHCRNVIATRELCTGEPIITIATAPQAGGELGPNHDSFAINISLAEKILAAGKLNSFPVAPITHDSGEIPLVWGALIPLWYTLRPHPQPRPKLVVVTPSPAVSRKELFRFGQVLGQLIVQSDQRLALIATADHGHTHDPHNKKFGFSPASAQYDELYCRAVKDNRLDRLFDVSDQMLIDSWADSLWQTLLLAGALESAPLQLAFFNYALPTYFGMAVALYEPATTGTATIRER